MGALAGRLEPWLVVLASTSLLAWSLLFIDGSALRLPPFCSASVGGSPPPAASIDLAFAINYPAKFASGTVVMIIAMMSPLVVAPLRHVRERTFVRRRARSTLLFLAGYVLVWMSAGMALQAFALAVRGIVPTAIDGFGAAVVAAMLWQISPAKQWCLNRCHRHPHLAAFGTQADRAAFVFGLTNGSACAGACWALMLLPLLLIHGHVIGMSAVTLFVIAERVERPAALGWRWRGLRKALRIARALARHERTSLDNI
jgi:predicted metal-binding membrane protein